MPVLVHLRIRTAEGRSAELLSFLRRAIEFYERPGGIRVRLFQSKNDPRNYIEVIEYEDDRAYDLDRLRVESDAEMGRYLEEWRSLLSADPQVETYRDLTAELRSQGT